MNFIAGEIVLIWVAATVGILLEVIGDFCQGAEDNDVVEVEVFNPLGVIPYS